MAKHSNVCYIYRKTGFEAVEKATRCNNTYGLDLFKYKEAVYEGRSGIIFINLEDLPKIDSKIESLGGIDKLNERIAEVIAKHGESPRYTRPDERKDDLFPHSQKHSENKDIILAKDAYGKKHYYHRFYNENGIELYTLKNAKESYRTIYVNCEGYMIGLDQHHRLEEALERLNGYENGVKGEIERVFNTCMDDPCRWADIGYANILGRVDEAKAHNEPIIEKRRLENEKWSAEREARRIAEEKATKEEYEQAIKVAEDGILSRSEVKNSEIQGKSIIMQLFRKYGVSVPLKTQGWIINSLCDIYYNENRGYWSYHYTGNNSTVFREYLPKLISAVQTGHMSEETI